MQTQIASPPKTKLPVKPYLLLAALLFFMWMYIAFDLNRARTQAFHNAQIQLDNLTGLSVEGVSSSIAAIDYALADLRTEWGNNSVQFAALIQQKRAFLEPSVAFNVVVLNADGNVIWALNSLSSSPINARDREYFKFHSLNPGDELHISKPMLSRTVYRLAIQFTRPLPRRDGQFDGVIVMSVSPEYFSRFHEKIDLGKDSVITLARTNGDLITRSPRPGQAVDTTIEDAPWLGARSNEQGFFQSYSELDGIERLYAWHVLEKGDLAVIMGQSVGTILVPYYQQRTAYLAWGTVATFFILLLAILLRKQHRQRAKATAEKQRMEQALAYSQKLESLGKLTGGVAHDFNNLLQIMSSDIQLLEMTAEGNEGVKPHLKSLADATKHGAKLVSQLLTFARRQPLHPAIVELGKLLENIDDLIKRLVGSNIEVKTSVSENTWNIHVDPGLLENVILNLAANARDAMNGKGTLSISVGNATIEGHQAAQYPDIVPGEYVSFSMTDTGWGMSAEVMEQAFEPFFTTKPEGKGTGLGLAAAYGFVKGSGGHIYIESALGKGTKIQIFLPRSFNEVAASLPEVFLPFSTGGTETILFVEDNPRLRAMTGMMLEHLGYRVLKAADAKEALAILEKDKTINVLFTDIDMPGGINGIELAEKAKSICPDLTILLASGYDDWDGSTEATATVQDFPFLNKPYTTQEADAMIKKLLSQKEHGTVAELEHLTKWKRERVA
jgi:signal transduction histidine kinase/FixJ family two-component response regulator